MQGNDVKTLCEQDASVRFRKLSIGSIRLLDANTSIIMIGMGHQVQQAVQQQIDHDRDGNNHQ